MPYASPACFRAGAAEAEAEAAPRRAAALATSVYETRVGIVALSWSRSRLGLSLRVDLLLSPSDDDDDDDEEETLRFRIRPWLLWKRRGSKRFPLKRHARRRRSRFVDLAWDLTRARFSDAAAPEPAAGYFVSVAVDGEVVLVADPSAADHHRGHPHRHLQTLISRREHVVIGGTGASRAYRTTARLGGREREIAMELGEGGAEKAKGRGRGSGEVGMLIMVDGNCALHVPRLRWTFRGSATVAVAAAEGGGRIRVSWDLHNWLFRLRSDSAPAPTAFEDAGDAVFVFQFEPDEDGDTKENFDKEEGGDLTPGTQFSCRWRRKRSLLKASSSSSSSVSSTASTSSTSSVAGWASPEEAEMQRGDAFSLLVYAWRN